MMRLPGNSNSSQNSLIPTNLHNIITTTFQKDCSLFLIAPAFFFIYNKPDRGKFFRQLVLMKEKVSLEILAVFAARKIKAGQKDDQS